MQDTSIEVEFDHALGPINGRDLALRVRMKHALLGDVGGELHNLDGLTIDVKHRAISGYHPYRLTVLTQPLVFPLVELAYIQPARELRVLCTRRVLRGTEHTVMAALHFV